RRRTEPLRRQDDEVDPRRKDFRRLSAQLARADLGRRLVDAGARGRAGVGTGDLAGAWPHPRWQSIHGAEPDEAPRRPQARSVAGHFPRKAEAARFGTSQARMISPRALSTAVTLRCEHVGKSRQLAQAWLRASLEGRRPVFRHERGRPSFEAPAPPTAVAPPTPGIRAAA